jgi:hypothetical protein
VYGLAYKPHSRPAVGPKTIAVAQQHIELATVAPEFTVNVKDRGEPLLHLGEVRTDADSCSRLCMQVCSAREVVRVDLGFHKQVYRSPSDLT